MSVMGERAMDNYMHYQMGVKAERERVAKVLDEQLFTLLGRVSIAYAELPIEKFDNIHALELGNEFMDAVLNKDKVA